MCGIVGYVGPQQAQGVVVEGLRRLEYRGYDSAGVALVVGGSIASAKRAGKIANLDKALADEPLPEATTGIGHTRWATHGAPNDANAHPHLGRHERVALVHNGIIENFAVLRAELEDAGHELRSETDTEIAAHLLEAEVAGGADLTTAMQNVCRRLEGAFTLVAVDAEDPSRVVAARRNSPLVVGVGEGENFLASDVAAFIGHTRDALELGQDQVVTITREGVDITDFEGRAAEAKPYHVDWDLSAAEKDGYDWFMRKEIYEQPRAIADSMLGRHDESGALQLDEIRISEDELRDVDKIIIVACGTAFYAGLVAKYAIEHWTRIPCEVELAHEFRYRDPILTRDTLVVAISQSGETADTLMAIRHAREPAVQGARDLQHQRLHDPARVRRGDLHPRRPGDRGRLDQGVHDPAGRHATCSRSTSPRCGAPSSATRSPRPSPSSTRCRPTCSVSSTRPPRCTSWRPSCPRPSRCSSWAGTPATRSPSKAR